MFVGERVRAICYFTIDYRRDELHPELIGSGPRTITDGYEWTDPPWRFDGFDAMDYGFEVITESGATFSVTWDPPGDHEGIGLQPVQMIGSGVRSDADVAIWVLAGRTGPWAPMIGRLVTAVDLHYLPWNEESGSQWCPHITLHGEQGTIDVVMGDSRDGTLVPSADNVAVLHHSDSLPAWLRFDDRRPSSDHLERERIE